MGKLNLIWSACSNLGGTKILEQNLCQIIFDVVKSDKGFFKLFCQDVLKGSKIDEFENADIDIEYKVEEFSSKIDLVVKTNLQIIPIEVKIDAYDQDKQCSRYLEVAKKYNKNNIPARVYYLAKDGRKPSAGSLDDKKILADDELAGNDDGIICISFKNEIMTWLKDCSTYMDNLDKQFDIFRDMIEDNL